MKKNILLDIQKFKLLVFHKNKLYAILPLNIDDLERVENNCLNVTKRV